jgi:hypothetical protein
MTQRFFSSILALVLMGPATLVPAAEPPKVSTHSFPADESVLNVKTHFGAKGDGKSDDTEALQRAIEASCGTDEKHRGKSNVVFLPNGTYRVTKTIVVKTALGPWLYGESRNGVILKLDDGVATTGDDAVTCVLRTHPNEKGPTSADWFMRNLRSFTIDVGNNPEVDGIRYYSTNTGCLQDVRVQGRGKIGVNAGFLDQSGPNLVQDVEIDGFETGILSQWIWGQTLSRIKITNCRKVGLEVSANVVAVEDLSVENTPMAIENKVPNDWKHWGGLIALTGGRFTGGSKEGPAIRNEFGLYARNVDAVGFRQVLSSTEVNGDVSGNRIDEYLSFPAMKIQDDSADGSLKLPIKQEPQVPWEHDHSKWLCVDDFGINARDNEDDSDAIQKAFDAAAKQGKTVVYFRGCGGHEPNWLTIHRPIRVPSPVRWVLGLGWARILRDKDGGFIVDDNSAPVVKFRNIDSFGGTPVNLTNASRKNTMVVESCGVSIVGQGQGDIFLTDCPAGVDLQTPGQSCWARRLNPEGTSDVGLVRNNGSRLWCLGVKHEGRGVRFATRNGGQTEILGLFNYAGYPDETDQRPLFDVQDASLTAAGVREIAFDSHTALIKARVRRGSDEKILDKHAPNAGGWASWTLLNLRQPPSKP